MIYDTLADFINKKMRMSHIYQPVMRMALLKKGGKCQEREIASDLLDIPFSERATTPAGEICEGGHEWPGI
jgi:hypothetical protein